MQPRWVLAYLHFPLNHETTLMEAQMGTRLSYLLCWSGGPRERPYGGMNARLSHG